MFIIKFKSFAFDLGFFAVDSETGVVSVIRPLSGKGRSEPYTVKIQAMDKGNPPLHSLCHLLVVVGDISTNDGVPQFIRPTAGEVAYVHEVSNCKKKRIDNINHL